MSIFNNNHNNVIVCKDNAQQTKIFGLFNLVSHDPLVNVRLVDKKNAQNLSKGNHVKVFNAEYVIFRLRARYYAQQTFDALAVSTIVLGALSMFMWRSARKYYSQAYNTLSKAFSLDQSAENYLQVLQQKKAYRGILIGFLPLYLVGYVVCHVFTVLWKGLKAFYDRWQSAKPFPNADAWPTMKRFFGQLYNDFKKLYAPEDIANKSLYDYFNSAVVHILWYLVAIPASIVQSCLVAFVANDLAEFIEYMKGITEVYKGQHGYIPQEYISYDDDKPKFTMAPMILLVLPIYYVLQPVKWIMRGLGINQYAETQIIFLIDKINCAQGALYGFLEIPFSCLAAWNLKKNLVLHDKVSEADEVFVKRYTNLFKRPIGKQELFTGMSNQDRGVLGMLKPINELKLLNYIKENNRVKKAPDPEKSDQLKPMPVSVSASNLLGNNRASDEYNTLTSSDKYKYMI